MTTVKTGSDELVMVREALDAGATLHFLDQVKAKVTEAWDGTPCVTVLDARRAVAAAKASEWENDRLHSGYRAWPSQCEAEGAQVWRATYRSALAEAMRAQVKSAQRLSGVGSDPTDEYELGWAAGGGFPVALRTDPATDSKARDAVKAAREK